MRRGFTLLEVLVVFAILGILVGIAIPLYARYVNKAYRDTIISDVKNTSLAVEAFISDFKNVPDNFTCPASGYGPAVCDLTDGTNTLTGAVSVSKNVSITYEKVPACDGGERYRIHGVHALLSGWGFCFDACLGRYVETDGTGCP